MNTMFLTVLALGLSPLPAQPVKMVQPGTTRVAVVNVGFIFQNYERSRLFKRELEDLLVPAKKKAKMITDEMKQWSRQIEDGDFGDHSRDELIALIKKNRFAMEELDRTIKIQLGKKQEDNLVTLWKEVQNGVKTYAARNQIDLVIAYGDPLDKDLLNLFPNVNRKMSAMDQGGSLPLFIGSNVDISDNVVQWLNTRHRNAQTLQNATGAR